MNQKPSVVQILKSVPKGLTSDSFEADTVYLTPISGSDLGLSENVGDFVAPPQAIAVPFAEGQRSETFSVSIRDDLVREARESFGIVVLDRSDDDPAAALARRDWLIADNDSPVPIEPPASDLAEPFIIELAQLANSAYSSNSTIAAEAAGWTPVLIPGLGTSISAIDTFNFLESNVHFYEALVDGDRTLAVAFSGTQPDRFGVTDLITQIGNWDNLYDSHRAAIQSVLNWAVNVPNDDPFDDLVVTGHSMGGILTEFMLADEGLSDFTLIDNATGVTFGSPGSPDKSLTDRIINFTTLGDPVAMLHAGDFFGIETKAEDAAKLSLATLSYALAAMDGVDAVVREVGKTAAEELSEDILGAFSQRPSREGINVTMLRTSDNVFDIVGSAGLHGLSGPAGYLNSIRQLSDFYGSANRTGSEDLDFWLSGRDGWHYLNEPDTLDLLVSIFQGFGFGALNLALDKVRLVVGVSNAVTNTLQAITGAVVQMVEIGVDGIARAWGSLTDFVSGTRDVIGTTFDNISSTIEVGFKNLFFVADDTDFESGSAIIRVDTDADGIPDLETRLEGNYDLERFLVVKTEAGTSVFYSEQPQLISTELADILVGGTEGEVAWGDSGNDAIFGMGGADTLFGDEGDDTLDGGAGDDELRGGYGQDLLLGGEGNDTLEGGLGGDILSGGDGKDVLRGGEGADTLSGGYGEDWVHYLGSQAGVSVDLNVDSSGFQSASGGDAEGDVISGFMRINGSDHADILIGDDGNNKLIGRAGDDEIRGGSGHDLISGGDGIDELLGGDGDDSIEGGVEDDRLKGQDGNDWTDGGTGADRLWRDIGNDTMMGGEGRDRFKGGSGADSLSGGDDYDRLKGEAGNDEIFGENGNDRAWGGNGRDDMYGGDGKDRMKGQDGDDRLWGEEGNDRIFGGEGNDTLDGGIGNDKIGGDAGQDELGGGLGDDTLTGGDDADVFIFSTGADVITDFQDGIDTLSLDRNLWTGDLTIQEVLDAYASPDAGDTVFDFQNGATLRLTALADPDLLLDDINFV